VAAIVEDFNGDGIPDLALVEFGSPGTVHVLLGNGDGSFRSPHDYTAGGTLVGGWPGILTATASSTSPW